jgi:hypothetical protein
MLIELFATKRQIENQRDTYGIEGGVGSEFDMEVFAPAIDH